ncbi:hypothetical protein NLG97_g6884 [Lecanicillium saksenae]|uniref:Uncharacterized protein n=1 Tax=Lecanicillium saksenae TaxID=468837 RepID=A0ACC1QNX8_9HYPO|nr:hypothetical protein NLG97_g6884 [Lecanicillium saksenae]
MARSNLACGYAGLATAITFIFQQPSTLQGLCRDAAASDQEAFYAMRTFVFMDAVGTYDQDFWQLDAVQAAQTYPAVWHAAFAFTEKYRSNRYHKVDHKKGLYYQILAEEHHGHTVRSVRDVVGQSAISSAESSAVLLSSILLLGFNCLTDDAAMKRVHLRSAFEVFDQLESLESSMAQSVPGSVVRHSGVVRQVPRFRSQCSISSIPTISNSPVNWYVISDCDSFMSLTDAYDESLQLGVPCSQAIRAAAAAVETDHPVPEIIYICRLQFKKLKSKFLAFLQSRFSEDANEEGLLSLQIWSLAMELLLFLRRRRGIEAELEYDAWAPVFEKQAALAEKLHGVLKRLAAARQPMLPLQPFSFTSSAAAMLLSVARYRNGSVRGKVASILREWLSQDGMIHSGTAAAMMEARTQVEEEGFLLQGAARPEDCKCMAPEYIGALHRCHRHRLEHTSPGRAILYMYFWPSWRAPLDLVERAVPISWQPDGPYHAGQ